jgi:hypothetical protein
MRTAAICPTCATYENAVCVIYNGPTLSNINVPPLTDLQTALGSINASIGSVIALINSVAANPISLTTTGTSGPATLTGNALNVPNYQPTLQEVLTNDNNTDKTIVITNGAGTISNTLSPGNIEIKDITNNTYAYYTEDYIYLYDQNTTGTSYLNFPDPNDNATFNFPSTGGTLAITSDITLQNITAGTNKDLANAINLQGTGAGAGNTGLNNINAFGTDAAKSNSGAGNINAFGRRAAEDNSGENVNAFGIDNANGNSGDYVNGIGAISLIDNSGDHVNAFGASAGANNTYSYVNLLGYGASASANNQLVLSKDTGTYMARIGYGGITASRLYTLPNASGELVVSVNGVTPVNGDVTISTGLPYLVYSAVVQLISSGSGVQVLQVLQNTTGATMTLSSTFGYYSVTASSAVFTASKSVIIGTPYKGISLYNILGSRFSDTVMTFASIKTSDSSSGGEFDIPFFIEIRIYP